jgi:tRNA dimethylallyltransferase
MRKLIVILGPTCTGKTSLAEYLCRRFNGEIISADSRQVYKFMDIGTGKVPAVGGEAGVRTHMQDVVRPGQKYSVSDWSKAARYARDDIWEREKLPFIVGGTGFYIDVLLGNRRLAGVGPDYELRKKLEGLSTEELFLRLQKADPVRAGEIDRKNKVRLVRAAEILNSNCQKPAPTTTSNPNSNTKPKPKPIILGLTSSNEVLYRRADSWVEEILRENRLLEETARLVEKGYGKTIPMQGIIYKTVLEHFEHQLSYDEMKQRIKWDLHGYIRRQLTWFKKSPKGIVWFNIKSENLAEEVGSRVELHLDN